MLDDLKILSLVVKVLLWVLCTAHGICLRLSLLLHLLCHLVGGYNPS